MRQSGKESRLERSSRNLISPERREALASGISEEFAEELASGARHSGNQSRQHRPADRG